MKTLIVGLGEVGGALERLLSPVYPVVTKDLEEKEVPAGVEIMHVCIRYSPDFDKIVRGYMAAYKPRIVNICSTVPPGTSRALGRHVVHSTTRGLHPNLDRGLQAIKKHVGGPAAKEVAAYFARAGVRCVVHAQPDTTELAHILNNVAYGINLMFADEMARICRHYGVDYFEAVMKYTQTNNDGYEALDHASKRRMILTPPGGRIGGHCVVQSANLIPEDVRTPMLELLAGYNEPANGAK